MIYLDETNKELFKNVKIDCEKCFGLCCTALYFSFSEGFPQDKDAGTACINLDSNFKCCIHKDLMKKGLKGCISYDCFGAGQKVSSVTYKGEDWRSSPDTKKQMFDVFIIMRNLHEMLWYLMQSFSLEAISAIKNDIYSLILETEKLTLKNADFLIKLDVDAHRIKVNNVLKKVSELVLKSVSYEKEMNSKGKKKLSKRFDFLGADLRKTNLIGGDFKGALLIAANLSGTNLKGANFIGADLRDTNIKGADFSESLFITQMQVNSAKGDSNTKLPVSIDRPSNWDV